jgi:hypothetical protein
MWFVAKALPNTAINTDKTADKPRVLGRCRRHAPTMNGYPAVFEDDWCGDHKLDETKL